MWHGASRFGEAGGVRCDSVRLVQVRSGEAGMAASGLARCVEVRRGKAGLATFGPVWFGSRG